MKVLIIGSKGQLGTDLCQALQGVEIIPLTHADLEIANLDTVKNAFNEHQPDVVINTSAFVRVDDAEVEVEKAFQVNAIGALNVAKVCKELSAVNIYISTDYVFDGKKETPYLEDDTPNPINVYGLSKYAGELFTKNYSEKHYIIRVASLYGRAGAKGKGGNYVDFIIQKAKTKEEIKVVDEIFMNPTYTKDVSRMIYKLLKINPEFGVYHMVNEGYCSWYEFTKEIFSILGWEINITPIHSNKLNRLAKRPVFSALENNKLVKLGLSMRLWQEALKDYLIEKGWLKE